MKILPSTLCVAALLAATPLFAQSDGSRPVEWRRHFEGADAKSGVAYKMTEITQLPNTTEDRLYVLVEDATTHDRLVVRQVIDYFNHEQLIEVTDLDTKETAKTSRALPYRAITRAGAADEVRKNPELRRQLVVATTLNVNGVEFSASEAEWRTTLAVRDKRSALRRAASPQFLERLERLRVVSAGDSPVGDLCFGLLRGLLYNETCKTEDVEVHAAKPDCTFDASFKFDCSKESKERVARAKAAGETLERY